MHTQLRSPLFALDVILLKLSNFEAVLAWSKMKFTTNKLTLILKIWIGILEND